MSDCSICLILRERVKALEDEKARANESADFWMKRSSYWRETCIVDHNRLQHLSKAIRNSKENPDSYQERPVNEPSNHLKLVHSA